MRRLPLLAVVFLAGCSGPTHEVSQPDGSSDGGAEATADVPAPRPVAPVSVSYLTSRQPWFAWSLPQGADGAQVDVCSDRACTHVVTRFAASGSRGVPPAELPPGVAFWRLRGTLAGAVGTATSATWELVVPPQSAPVSTAWGAMLDADGDGYGDVVVGDSDAFTATQHVYVHHGGAQGPSATPTAVLSAAAPVIAYAASVASVGDVDGDGFADLAIGSPTEDTVYFYRGGSEGFSDPPSALLTGPPKSAFGASVSGAGDVNGDGYADVVVGLPASAADASPVLGGAVLYLGGPDGLSASRTVTLSPPAGSDAQGFGTFVSNAGDTNGDGLADVAVWGGIATTDPQTVVVYLGSAMPSGTPSAVLLYDGANPSWLGDANLLACGGDTNGDGYTDLVMATPVPPGGYATDHVSLFLGSPQGLALEPSRQIDSPLATTDHFAISVAGIDLDQDGFADVAVTAASYAKPPVSTLVYAGSVGGPSLATTMTTNDTTTLFEREVGSPGDVDGDGYPDLVVGFPSRTTGVLHGAVEVHPGGPAGASLAARWTLLPPDGSAVAYGASLARP